MKTAVKLLVMDVDGTLTDGKIYMGAGGELCKAFNIKDGYAINEMLPAHGIVPAIITGRTSAIVENRARELDTLLALIAKYHCTSEQVAYIGDDVLDLVCMRHCGVVGCPADACRQVKDVAHYVCQARGGDGAVREFVEWLLEA